MPSCTFWELKIFVGTNSSKPCIRKQISSQIWSWQVSENSTWTCGVCVCVFFPYVFKKGKKKMAFQMHEPEHGKAHDESGGIVVVVTTFSVPLPGTWHQKICLWLIIIAFYHCGEGRCAMKGRARILVEGSSEVIMQKDKKGNAKLSVDCGN